MAKKKSQTEKTEEQQTKTETPTQMEQKHPLIELVANCTEDTTWIIYNLARKGLLEQYEQEIQDYTKKEIEPTITIKEFEQIIQGQK